MPGPPDDIPLCWCCQSPFTGGSRGRVWLSSDLSIPVCPECWLAMPEAERVELAIKFRDRGARGDRIADAIEALTRLIERGGGGMPFEDLYDQPGELN